MDELQAFDATRVFLRRYFEETNGIVDVRLVLSGTLIERDVLTADPGARDVWMRAVETVLNAGD